MNSAPGPPERNGDGRRRRLGAAVLGIALIVPAVTFGLIAAVDPGRAWIGPVVWFLGSPGWLLVWIGVRLVRGRRPFGGDLAGGAVSGAGAEGGARADRDWQGAR